MKTIFSLIASRFRRVINPFDNIQNIRDLSTGKVGVLTSKKKWINEEIEIIVNGETNNFEVIKDVWPPF